MELSLIAEPSAVVSSWWHPPPQGSILTCNRAACTCVTAVPSAGYFTLRKPCLRYQLSRPPYPFFLCVLSLAVNPALLGRDGVVVLQLQAYTF